MPVIGFHNSHEQVHPAELLKAVQHAEEVGFTGAMSSDHFSPWSARQGQSGFGWSWLGRRPGDDVAAVRRGQRARPAVPPGDRRPGDRHARRDVPGPVLGGAGQRRGVQRAHHRAGLAAQGAARRPAARVRRRHPRAAGRRGGQPRRAGHRRPGAALDPARDPAGADLPGGQRRDGPRGRGLGRRPGHRQPAARQAPRDGRRLPGRRRPREARPAGAPLLGPRPRPGRWPSPTTSGAATSSRRRSAGTSTRRRRSTRPRST